MTRRRALGLAALVLVLIGTMLGVSDIRQASVARRAVDFLGPMDVQGLTLRLHETRQSDGWRIDLQWGEEVVAENLPLVPDVRAPQTDYAERYADQLWLYASRSASLPWQLLVVDRTGATPVYSRYVLDAAAPAQTQIVRGDLQTMRIDYRREVLVSPDGAGLRLPLPPPAIALLGVMIWLFSANVRLDAAPTLTLVAGILALASLVAWPVMMHVGPGRSLPPALLALSVTALVALGFGPRWQSALADKNTVAGVLWGVGVGLLLLTVFTLVWVQINGFMAPVFRPPGAGLSPGEWFVQDMVAPSLAVGGLGLLPALLAGGVYGGLCRAR